MQKSLIHRNPNLSQEKIYELHDVNSRNSNLKYISFKVIKMKKNEKLNFFAKEYELCIVPQNGIIKIKSSKSEKSFTISRTKGVFIKEPSDCLYVGEWDEINFDAKSDCEFLVAMAKSQKNLPTIIIKGDEINVEKRGGHGNRRTVFNILNDSNPIASSLIVVEVFTDQGNWSSYPPHKHDEFIENKENILEEIYFHKISSERGFVLQRIYDKNQIDKTFVVKNNDIILVKKGYHPVSVPPGYNSYYLNIMAGPIKKWNFTNDLDHEWIINK
ncbi:5-deoxy-glucuronate isomerase [Spiroplasma alleghenense]|uniref:5-deoxy-glucuronate isomerase n=1 Tax=Spiroplasma alleghenense TaxID=216931 RepID=A0A345Z3G1_9MOLU|nr:5-deoxy-glucuronate isomerase [Spiroplasma alleghenense]AXK51140.1 5-deoxy-glucuronate isomerase [Spiroplasma alleghenense]